MEFIIPVIFIIIVFVHALIDAYQIEKKGIYINHITEGIIYAVVCVISGLILGTGIIPLIVFTVLTRAAFFDGLLNLFRGKNFLYEGKASLIDRIERAIGLPTWLFRVLYLLIYVGYLIYYYATG